MAVVTPPSWLEGASHTALSDRLALAGVMGAPLAAFTNGVAAVGAGGGHGIVRGGDFAVSENDSPNMSVNIAAGTGFVRGSQVSHGVYSVSNDGVVNKAIAASNPTNPRNDLVIVRINDNFYTPASGDNWDFQIVTGTPAATPLDPVVSNNYMIIARVVVPAGVSSIVNANITDLRRYAAALGGIRRCTSTTRPSPALVGELAYETNTLKLIEWNGIAWRVVNAKNEAVQGCAVVSGVHSTTWTGTTNADVEVVAFGVTFASLPSVVAVPRIGGNLDIALNWTGAPLTTGIEYRAFTNSGGNVNNGTAYFVYWTATGPLAP